MAPIGPDGRGTGAGDDYRPEWRPVGDHGVMNEPLLVDPYAASVETGIPPGTIRVWLHRGHLTHHGHDHAGRTLIDLHELRRRLTAKAA